MFRFAEWILTSWYTEMKLPEMSLQKLFGKQAIGIKCGAFVAVCTKPVYIVVNS